MRPKDRDADKQEKKCKPERGGPRRPATLRSAMTAPTISAIAFDRRAPSGHVRLTSIRDVAQTSQMRKDRPFVDAVAKGANRPFAALQDRPCEQPGSAR